MVKPPVFASRTFSRAPDLPRLLENLGSEYKIRQITVKLYFCCIDIHPVIDALLDIKRENKVSLGDVENVLVERTTNIGTPLGFTMKVWPDYYK